jgi:glycosyltransferase involved in cell wall biosynthesis
MSAPSPRPKVSLILRSSVMGGVKTSIDALINSRLAESFDFAVVQPDEARRQLGDGTPRVFVFEDACAWRRVPELAAFKLRKGRSKVVIHELHYSEYFVRCRVPSPARFHAMLRISYALADRVVAISKGQADWLLARRLVSPQRIERVVLASPLAPLLALPPRAPARPLVLGAFGRFHPQKGFDVLLAAMRLLPRGMVRLRIAGSGPDEEMLRAQAAGLDDVEFVGARSDIAGFLAECGAVVIPSRWEPLGLVCQEANAAGKPVIASRVDGLTEQVEGCGILTPPEDPPALAKAIAEMAALPDETLRAWGARGRENVAGAMDASLRGWEKLFTGLMC